MAQGVKQPPSSVVIQTGTDQQSSLPPLPTLSGQPQSIPNNQYVMQQAITNGTASTAMILGIIGLAATILGPFTEGLTCFFGWFFGLLGIILGHVGSSKATQMGGVGRGNAVAGYVCGYITIVLYLIPIVFLLILFESWGI